MLVSVLRSVRLVPVAASFAIGAAWLAGAMPATAGPQYTFTTFDVPGSHFTNAIGVNDSGEIVGGYQDAANRSHGFLYKNGRFTQIDDPNAGTNATACGGRIGTGLTGINSKGAMVGIYFDPGCNMHGFRYMGGLFTTIDDPSAGSGGTYASDINDCGTIVGYYFDATGKYHGFVDTDAAFATIDDPTAGSLGGVAYGINDSNIIVGFYYDASNKTHGYKDVDGHFTNIDDPNATQESLANKLNDKGEIVGQYQTSSSTNGFLYINGVYTNIDDPNAGSLGTNAQGINQSGKIVGLYIDPTGQHHGFVATPH